MELLQRTKEWNEGLEKYCDDMSLTGVEREADVVQKHTARTEGKRQLFLLRLV
jgi:hypothetical protein